MFLDLRKNRYFGLGRDAIAAASSAFPEFCALSPQGMRASVESTPQVEPILQQLLSRGLLTTDRHVGRPISPASIDLSLLSASVGYTASREPTITLRHFVNFSYACVHSLLSLRLISLYRIAKRIESRRSAHVQELTPEEVAELIAVFRRLRSFTFSADGRCLFHALTLITFLSKYSSYPRLVIGIKTSPWGAHSWVQDGTLVLDSTPEIVRYYVPILSV